MDPKRKKIYIGLVIACVILSALILSWSKFTGQTPPEHKIPVTTTVIKKEVGKSSGNVVSGFTAPAVFPATDKFASDVLESEEFLKLKPFDPVVNLPGPAGLLGRENPFNSY